MFYQMILRFPIKRFFLRLRNRIFKIFLEFVETNRINQGANWGIKEVSSIGDISF